MCITSLLPEGNIPMPNAQLQVKWFYMTFHKSDCTEYVQSGCRLSNKMLQTIAEYFQLIHETCKNNGSLMRYQIEKIWAEAKRELRHKLEEQYARKKCLLSDKGRSYRLHKQCNSSHHYCQHGQREQCQLHDGGSRSDNKCNNRKSPPKRKDKDFKPCCIHGKHAKHSYKECHANPRNQAHQKLCTNNNKRRHESSHYNNNRYTSSDNESRESAHTPMPSNGNASANNKSKAEVNFYLSEGKKNKKRRSGNVPSSSCSSKSGITSNKRRNSDIDLDWDEMF